MTGSRLLRGVLVPLAALLIWQALSARHVFNPQVLPSPLAVFSRWLAYLKPLEAFDPAQMSRARWLRSRLA